MDFLGDLVRDVVGDVVAAKAGKGLRRVLGRRGPGEGSAGCALKIISGSQDGLSQHWRLGAAQFAPSELRFAQHRITRPPVTLLAARETADRVSIPRWETASSRRSRRPPRRWRWRCPAGSSP